jgi:hypothetical protein
MGRSTGESVPFCDPQDVDDHEKVIAWSAAQHWCNGEAVLFGTVTLGADLVLTPHDGTAPIIQDDLGNAYDRAGGPFSNYRH